MKYVLRKGLVGSYTGQGPYSLGRAFEISSGGGGGYNGIQTGAHFKRYVLIGEPLPGGVRRVTSVEIALIGVLLAPGWGGGGQSMWVP
jgi:hypothetical protein